MFDAGPATAPTLTSAELRAAVARYAETFDPNLVDADRAAELVSEWAAIEHIAAIVKALAAARVADTSTWKKSGSPSAADWFARTTGTTAARAREQLATATRLRELDATAAAAKRGEVSPDQAAAIADAATADPDAEQQLLGAAGRESLGELRDRCQRTKAAADPDPDTTRRRIHANRSLRRWAGNDGSHHLHANGPAELLARIDAALRPIADKLFAAARTTGHHESPDAYAFDALVGLADQSTTTATATATATTDEPTNDARRTKRARYRAIIRLDLEALLRGSIEGDETCEIAGLGPIPISIARSLLGESTLHLVLTKGVDVANVTYLGRGPTAAQRIALLWQMPACTRLGCNRRARLQVDHRRPYADCRVTELANLDPLCAHDHRLKTTQGWALVDGEGKRALVPPEHPDHPRRAAARAPC